MQKIISILAAFLAITMFVDGFNHPNLAVSYSFFTAVLVTVGVISYPFRVCGTMNP